MPESADEKDYDLDLRKPSDLERSHLLHRLSLLKIPWGDRREQHGKKGTFHEFWRLQWKPEFVVNLIEAARWGNTVARSASACIVHTSGAATTLPALTDLLDDALLADLPDGVSVLMAAIRNQAAVGSDVLQLMAALPALAPVSRYGNARRTDVEMIIEVVDGLIARICVGLPMVTASLNEEAARGVLNHIVAVNDAVTVLRDACYRDPWNAALERLAEQKGLHTLIAGRSVRIIYDGGAWDRERVARSLSLALSAGSDPAQSAAWLEGFLSGSGLLLLHDEIIWGVIDEWVCGLNSESFVNVLPLVRRTFSTFAAPERRQMGERVKRGGSAKHTETESADFDFERANAVLPLLAKIFGVEQSP